MALSIEGTCEGLTLPCASVFSSVKWGHSGHLLVELQGLKEVMQLRSLAWWPGTQQLLFEGQW